jgi:hypothetical protein
MSTAHHPRAEATALVPAGHEARVLEPSPPANTDPAWFADDPTDPAGADGPVVTPVADEGVEWSSLDDPAARAYAADHWLDGHRRLEPLPPSFDECRRALHQIAYFVVAAKRFAANGKLGLRYTHGGFGTPFFGDDEQVRVEDGVLVHQRAGSVRTETITSVAGATAFLDMEYRNPWFEGFHDPLDALPPDTHLEVDPAAAGALGAWFGFSTHVLERARRTPGAVEVSRLQLWPEHFDPAFEMGSGGSRASYGASPGDAAHPQPYLYVAPWGEVNRANPVWNDPVFAGASLDYARLLDADDPYRLAAGFFAAAHAELTG